MLVALINAAGGAVVETIEEPRDGEIAAIRSPVPEKRHENELSCGYAAVS